MAKQKSGTSDVPAIVHTHYAEGRSLCGSPFEPDLEGVQCGTCQAIRDDAWVLLTKSQVLSLRRLKNAAEFS